MTDVRPDDVAAPVDAPAPAAPGAQPGGDAFDRDIAEFDRATASPQPDSSPAAGAAPQANYDEIDRLLDELSKPGPLDGGPLFGPQQGGDPQRQQRELEQLSALQSENAQLRSRIQSEIDRQDFSKFADGVQQKLPPSLPGDYAAVQLKSMAMDRPELVLAFDGRHLDRRAVDAELRQVEAALSQTRDPQMVQHLNQMGYRLGAMLNSKEILRRATHEIIKRGREHAPIDETATADHDAVVFHMRGASGKGQPEPPPNFGNMSDKELSRYTKEHFGF
jgi:hypothetical protein